MRRVNLFAALICVGLAGCGAGLEYPITVIHSRTLSTTHPTTRQNTYTVWPDRRWAALETIRSEDTVFDRPQQAGWMGPHRYDNLVHAVKRAEITKLPQTDEGRYGAGQESIMIRYGNRIARYVKVPNAKPRSAAGTRFEGLLEQVQHAIEPPGVPALRPE